MRPLLTCCKIEETVIFLGLTITSCKEQITESNSKQIESIIEGFRGKPVPVKVQMAVTQSSFFLLVGLSVLLIIRDTSQLLVVQKLLNQ